MPDAPLSAPLQPVIVGGDIGAYSLARAFHEAYQVRSIVVSAQRGWHISRSAIIAHELCEDTTDPAILSAHLQTIAERIRRDQPSARVLLLGSADATVKSIIRVRDDYGPLPDGWHAPYVGMDAFEAGTEKNNFTRLCEDLGVAHPRTRIIDLAHGVPDDLALPFAYPVIAKPADVSAWKHISFDGQSKVHSPRSEEELRQLLHAIHQSGYHHSIIVQDMIPGDDQNMRILTVYCDEHSSIRFAAWGRTLLEEHTPGALGNPAAIITGHNPAIVADAQKIVSALSWRGYANFDLKYDPRDGSTVFFELNPRLGRSNYYVTAGGHNPVKWYVAEHLEGGLGDNDGIIENRDEVLYTVVPTALVKHYTTDPDARALLERVLARGAVKNPLRYWSVEKDVKRRAYFAAAMLNYVKKFRTHYRPQRMARELP